MCLGPNGGPTEAGGGSDERGTPVTGGSGKKVSQLDGIFRRRLESEWLKRGCGASQRCFGAKVQGYLAHKKTPTPLGPP